MNMTEEQLDLYQRGALPQRSRRGVVKAPKAPKATGGESAIVSACIKWLWAHGCYVWRNNTGAYKPEGSNRYIAYGHKGSADILGVTKTGRFIACECKRPGKGLEPTQELFRNRVQEKGGLHITARALEDLERRKYEILGGM